MRLLFEANISDKQDLVALEKFIEFLSAYKSCKAPKFIYRVVEDK